jgi:hypothetical protein
MRRMGFSAFIAAPKNDNSQYLPDGHFVRLRSFGDRLFGANKLRGFDGKTVALDKQTAALAKKAGLPAIKFYDRIGIDLSVWNPKAISGKRQTMLMALYNIPPASRLVLVIEPSEKDVRHLIQWVEKSNQNNFIIALYGKMTKRTAKRINRRLDGINGIIYLGNEQDLPTLMRASFAVMSMSARNDFYKIAALAMGRPAAFPAGEIKPNIPVRGNPAAALEKILDMTAKSREMLEAENIVRAREYSLEKNIDKLKKLIG